MSDSEQGGPPRLERVRAPGALGGAYGLAAREVTPAAAFAAGLAWEGTLAQDGPLHLYYLAAAAQAQGRLDLATERGRFALYFKRGAVEHASSDAPEDDLGRHLLAKGVLTAEALAQGEQARAGHGGDLVTALAATGLMNPAESFRALQEHGAAVVARALGTEKGTARFTPGAAPPASSFPLGSRWGLLCEAVRRLDGLAVRKLLGARADRVALRVGGRVDLGELKLTAVEARAAGLFDGTSSPAQLAAAHPPEGEVLLRVTLLLAETELLRFGAEAPRPPAASSSPAAAAGAGAAIPPRPAAPSPSPREAPRAPGRGAAPSPAAAAPAPAAAHPKPAPAAKPAAPTAPKVPADPAALQALLDRVSAADHFEALGVKRDAPVAQIKAAYFQLARLHHPDAAAPGEPESVKKLRADIFARLGAAWGVLSDDASRAEYLQQLASGGPGEVDVSAIFKAEELFQRATLLVKTRQYEAALETLDEAIQLNADEAEFGVWRAWVEFLIAPDRTRQHAASTAAMEAALKKVPRCMAAYLFLGQMAKIAGDAAAAEKQLKRGLALDPEHADLARELKYLRR